MTKITAKILKGTKDVLPEEMRKRNYVLSKITNVFERFSYAQIETPILSYKECLVKNYGEEGEKLSYTFKDQGGRELALPYDLTVPLARFFASNCSELAVPFKRYQIQRVWRADKPQKGRFREFYQCDVDVIGSESLVCEAEFLKLFTMVFEEIGLENYVVKINSRRLLNDILLKMGVKKEDSVAVISIIDKVNKIGTDGVIKMLFDLGIKNGAMIMELLKPESTNFSTLKKLKGFDLSEIETVLNLSKSLNVDLAKIQFDPSLARGLDYYTGISFEVYSLDLDIGAIASGGAL